MQNICRLPACCGDGDSINRRFVRLGCGGDRFSGVNGGWEAGVASGCEAGWEPGVASTCEAATDSRVGSCRENMCASMDLCKCGYVRTQADTQAGRLRNTHMVFGFRQDFRAPRLRISFGSWPLCHCRVEKLS